MDYMLFFEDWSFESILGKALAGKTSVATASTITIAIPSYVKSHEVLPAVTVSKKSASSTSYKIIDTLGLDSFPLNLKFTAEIMAVNRLLKDQIILSRHLTGHGQERGGVKVSITNSYQTSIKGLYLEVLPWYMRYYFHSLADARGKSLLESKYILVCDE